MNMAQIKDVKLLELPEQQTLKLQCQRVIMDISVSLLQDNVPD